MDMILYGQAEYYYAVQKEILDSLISKNIITEDQYKRIDELNRKVIFEMYPSIDDMEVESGINVEQLAV